ncbi:MAG: methionyl-tRNA formyltransferase [Acidobacteria bacterium]|nr:methionyl-tRNA formyltransferase [Acidobacteriota bacterium]
MPSLRLVFFGTPAFAVPTLRALVEAGYPVAAAVTQPDKARDRGQRLKPGAVKEAAAALGIPVLQPARLRDEDFQRALSALGADLGVVAAYGKILPPAVLDAPRFGLVNVHASLLPRWRGASPIQRAIMAGDAETGVSIMRIVQALDAGPVFDTARRAIGPDETAEEVERDLAVLGAGLLVRVLGAMERGEARETPQDEAAVAYAPPLTKEDGRIDWSRAASDIHNQVRALQPWPHAFTSLAGARLIVLRTARPQAPPVPPGDAGDAPPGTLLSLAGPSLAVATGAGPLHLVRVQAEGRRPLTGREFAAGARLKPGIRFGA